MASPLRLVTPALVLAVALGGTALLGQGCSSDPPAATGCDSARCAAGNRCLPLNGETKCRKTCASNTDPATSCPAGYTCVAHPDSEPFCEQQDPATVPPPGPKQWGTLCGTPGGVEANPACDSAQGFFCFAQSPQDADAYCTKYDCTKDLDCAPGFFCGDANVAPNAKTATRTFGQTVKVCQKRAYCAPCQADFDCPSVAGSPQRCITDDDGVGFCTQECDQAGACGRPDARCSDVGGIKVCYPRAGRCKGNGELCSPCRSDADCPQGTCVTGEKTNEKSCTVKSPAPCKLDDANGKACPAPAGPAGRVARCLGNQQTEQGLLYPEIPKDECHGYYQLGEGGDIGCWTPNR